MAVGALNGPRAAYRPPTRAAARQGTAAPDAQAGAGAGAQPQPGPNGVVRSEAAKAGYKAWLKGRMKAMFEDMIATATKKHS